jgi:hypothetical protein
MFAAHEVTLDLDFPAARARLALLMRGDWLDSVSQDAYAEGLSGQLRVGPFGPVPGMSKLVEVRLLDPVPHGDGLVVPLRWEATGLMAGSFRCSTRTSPSASPGTAGPCCGSPASTGPRSMGWGQDWTRSC